MKNKVGGKVVVADDIEASEKDKLDKLNMQHGTNVDVQDGYPTIYKIVGGKVEYYNGERTEKELISWALKSDSKQSNSKRGGSKQSNRRQSRNQRQSNRRQSNRRQSRTKGKVETECKV